MKVSIWLTAAYAQVSNNAHQISPNRISRRPCVRESNKPPLQVMSVAFLHAVVKMQKVALSPQNVALICTVSGVEAESI